MQKIGLENLSVVNLIFKIDKLDKEIKIFTTRPDTILELVLSQFLLTMKFVKILTVIQSLLNLKINISKIGTTEEAQQMLKNWDLKLNFRLNILSLKTKNSNLCS